MKSEFVFNNIHFSIEFCVGFHEITEISVQLMPDLIKTLTPLELVYVNEGEFSFTLSDVGHFASARGSSETKMFMFEEDKLCSRVIAKIIRADLDRGFAKVFSSFVNNFFLRTLPNINQSDSDKSVDSDLA